MSCSLPAVLKYDYVMIASGLFSNFLRSLCIEAEHLLYLSAFCIWSRNVFALLIQNSMFCIPEIQFSNVVVKPPTTFSLSIEVGKEEVG